MEPQHRSTIQTVAPTSGRLLPLWNVFCIIQHWNSCLWLCDLIRAKKWDAKLIVMFCWRGLYRSLLGRKMFMGEIHEENMSNRSWNVTLFNDWIEELDVKAISPGCQDVRLMAIRYFSEDHSNFLKLVKLTFTSWISLSFISAIIDNRMLQIKDSKWLEIHSIWEFFVSNETPCCVSWIVYFSVDWSMTKHFIWTGPDTVWREARGGISASSNEQPDVKNKTKRVAQNPPSVRSVSVAALYNLFPLLYRRLTVLTACADADLKQVCSSALCVCFGYRFNKPPFTRSCRMNIGDAFPFTSVHNNRCVKASVPILHI